MEYTDRPARGGRGHGQGQRSRGVERFQPIGESRDGHALCTWRMSGPLEPAQIEE
jgi:hypothetical protein